LKLTGCKLSYLLNFGEEVMRTGITRCVNGLEEQPLRHCASAGEEKVPTTGCYVAGIPSHRFFVNGNVNRCAVYGNG